MQEWLQAWGDTLAPLIPLLVAVGGIFGTLGTIVGTLLSHRLKRRFASVAEVKAQADQTEALANLLEARTDEWKGVLQQQAIVLERVNDLNTALVRDNARQRDEIYDLRTDVKNLTERQAADKETNDRRHEECERLTEALTERVGELLRAHRPEPRLD